MRSMSVQHCDLPGTVSDLPYNKHAALASRLLRCHCFPDYSFIGSQARKLGQNF